MPDNFDPYYKWLGIPPEEQPPHFYRLLGVPLFEADSDVIEAAVDRQLTHLRAKAAGPRSEAARKLLKEVALAQVTLLEKSSKAVYDAKLKKKLAPTPPESPSQPSVARGSSWADGTVPQSVEDFQHCLAAAGIMKETESAAFLESLPAETRPGDAKSLAQALVRAKKLTKYQAGALYQGKVRHLVYGEYLILDKIGAGGMGQVFKAEHRRMKRIVAIKVLPAAVMKDADAVRRFQREVEAAARLTHPNIVTAFDADEADGVHFLVMEYVEGQDLSAIVKQHGAAARREGGRLHPASRPRPGVRPWRRGSSIATSSRPTCCSTRKGRSRSSTWAWPASTVRRRRQQTS